MTNPENKERAERVAALAGKINEVLMADESTTFTEVFHALSQNVVLITLDYLNFTGKLSTKENFAEVFNRFIVLVGKQAEYAMEQERIQAQIAEFAQSGLILPEQRVIAPAQGIIQHAV